MYLIEEQREEDLWQIWLHKWIEKDFEEWKEEINSKNVVINKKLSEEEERGNIDKAERILGRVKNK
ncbi:peptide methionine sulfoxide reductase [Clostridium sp.]|uniref:peptide methionine sulfoxide reductase n=1 Tax=Clostridium sp. TaxID=1506 RepID=UPI00257984B0|nr:peptide methionine sulfoxide reductase [Clostridium sp.]